MIDQTIVPLTLVQKALCQVYLKRVQNQNNVTCTPEYSNLPPPEPLHGVKRSTRVGNLTDVPAQGYGVQDILLLAW